MATKLKNLRVSKVDVVNEGANPDAYIKLFKRKDTGDKGNGSSKGEEKDKGTGVIKKLFTFIGKAAGMGEEEIAGAIEEIRKGEATSFRERFNEVKNRKIADEIWDICYALQAALCSILNDDDLDDESALAEMQDSLDDFQSVMQACIKQWSSGNESHVVTKKLELTEAEVEIAKSARDRLSTAIEKASAEAEQKNITQEGKGEQEMGMKIDKSKMTPAEAAFLESIEKRYGTEEDVPAGCAEGAPGAQAVVPVVAKAAGATGPEAIPEVPTLVQGYAPVVPGRAAAPEDDIYKGLHPAVKAELEELKKFRESTEERELREVAKRYAIIGKKEEELVPLLKSLKAAGGSAYHDMIAVLDQAADTVEKSGAFSEIGKSGHGGAGGGFLGGSNAEAKISTIAKGYMEKDQTLSYSEAMAKAWEDNPEIFAEYDEEAGF